MGDGIQKLDSDISRILRSQAVAVSLVSAVREVIQNSTDAGATVLKAMIDPYQMSFLVRDNGCGLSHEDLELIGCQNFTSKMRNLDDLRSLNTFGFRGEALFCIANVAQLTLISKKSDYSSSWIRDIPGRSRLFKATKEETCYHFPIRPMAKEESGTIVIVRNILHNIPIRRRMLEKDPLFKTLLALREEFFQVLILKPEISLNVWYFDHLGHWKELISSTNITESMNPFMKLSHLFSNTFGQIIPVDMFTKVSARFRDCSLSGLISKCSLKPKEPQYIYLNGRRYADSSFQKLINSIFQMAGFDGCDVERNSFGTVSKALSGYPLIILDVRCPQVAQDLIQDPSKTIISSSHAQVIHPLILRVIKSFLSHQGYIPDPRTDANNSKVSDISMRSTSSTLPSRRITNQILNSNRRVSKLKTYKRTSPIIRQIENSKIKLTLEKLKKVPFQENLNGNEIYENSSCMHTSKWNGVGQTEKLGEANLKLNRLQLFEAEIIGQIDKKFILFKVPSNKSVTHAMLVIVDQHACDERINLEKYLNDFLYQVLEGTLMSEPVSDCTVEIDIIESYLFQHYNREFRKWGIFYEIKNVSWETCFLMVSSLPEVLMVKTQGDKQFLKNVLLQMVLDLKNSVQMPIESTCDKYASNTQQEEFQWWKYLHCLPRVFREMFNSRACRSAIMFGDFLSNSECSLLIRRLAQCHTPFQCAHGRPSAVPLLGLGSMENRASEQLNAPKNKLYLDYDI